MSAVTFVVPGQPQGKGRAKIVKIGGFSRMATPAKTVAYEGLVAHAAQMALAGRPLLQGPVHVRLAVECQVPGSWSQKKQRAAINGEVMPTTKPDIDNVIKAVFDGCNGVLWKDDVQVVQVTVVKQYSATPCVRFAAVELQPVSADQPQRELLGEPA
ncbi:RusA family crossover junction endodeoxyribonuclease [Roseateles depolymerans]|uniref:Endodeoxyribonuclease RusA n=1 Tax=Roseateles depolymerans TaxID=76731 RepID=A0A0U3MGR7_9BURK|nr:RusA family crossover junction endodeoxyribonuclease [Roseateles depolymerans]ALV06684.1 Endodeoxyribonuclease RusA [Roseateles depolymerans]REG19661.1 Holliday junction resolvase RusA-like endonuclease [Roseateles depolymerans]